MRNFEIYQTQRYNLTDGIADIKMVVPPAKAQNNYQLLNTAIEQLQYWGVLSSFLWLPNY
jgi:hypothetical protein